MRQKQERECKKHGFVIFGQYKDPALKGGFRWRCTKCVGEGVTKRKRKIKQILVDEAGGKCQNCGYNRCLWALEFHHKDPKAKSFSVNMGKGVSLDRFRAEAKKCVLLCANCHREIEAALSV